MFCVFTFSFYGNKTSAATGCLRSAAFFFLCSYKGRVFFMQICHNSEKQSSIGVASVNYYIVSDTVKYFFCELFFADEHKVRSIGVSNYESKHIKEIKEYGKMMPSVNQVEFHPHFVRKELWDYCKSEGIFFQVCVLGYFRELSKVFGELDLLVPIYLISA